MAGANLQFDHFVLLVPYDYLDNPPSWIKDNFTLSPGGRHGDNKTENRLVLFRDGSYLEIIAFIDDDPEKRRGHWWDKPFGVVDYALTSESALDYEGLQNALKDSSTDLSYAEPKPGGRVTGGKEIRWKVTFPDNIPRGNVPFFCQDVTPRDWRVAANEANTTHPSGALGVAGVLLEVKKDRLERLSKATGAIVDPHSQTNKQYEVGVPNSVERLKKPSIRLVEAPDGSDKELALTLILQTGDQSPKDAIRAPIGDGLVSIDFE